ncbi:hypothetical protein J6590_094242 [Homalodisca vitripennis]|nr:hypothetical protein J6590_094242 [Homalodisca vitripennis]
MEELTFHQSMLVDKIQELKLQLKDRNEEKSYVSRQEPHTQDIASQTDKEEIVDKAVETMQPSKSMQTRSVQPWADHRSIFNCISKETSLLKQRTVVTVTDSVLILYFCLILSALMGHWPGEDLIKQNKGESRYSTRSMVLIKSAMVTTTRPSALPIYPYMSYCITLWGSCSHHILSRDFVLQKRAIRVIAKLGFRKSCRESFRRLEFLKLPFLCMYETVFYCRYKCKTISDRDVYVYNTRVRDVLRVAKHRLRANEALPRDVGAELIKSTPLEIMSSNQEEVPIPDVIIDHVSGKKYIKGRFFGKV